MKITSIALFVGVVGCAFAQPVSAMELAKGSEKVLYSFCSQLNCTDGEEATSVINVKSTLYGTTQFGGDYGYGTVFALNAKTGAEMVLHSFGNGTDGQQPYASLIDVNGMLYGTTGFGGTQTQDCSNFESGGCGTVFAITPSGIYKVLYSFCSQKKCKDGYQPAATLIDVKGTLYGTASLGGNTGCNSGYGCGTVFSLDPTTGTEKVLHSFGSGTDGQFPVGTLIDVKGTLYGATTQGGADGGGTVFALDVNTGAETVLYSFCSHPDCADGASPSLGGLIYVNGTLYGTTDNGGAGSGGTVFALDPKTGVEQVLHYFCSQANCADGEYPFDDRLIDVKGTLYGTTYYGGMYGYGTVFALDPDTGAETVLHSFCQQSCTDGSLPGGGLIDVKDKLYAQRLMAAAVRTAPKESRAARCLL